MDLCIRFWNNEKCQVDDKYWYCVFQGHTATHMDPFVECENGVNLDATRITQVSMDGTSVNYKFLQKLKEERIKFSRFN